MDTDPIEAIALKYPRLHGLGHGHDTRTISGWAMVADELFGAVDALLDDGQAGRPFLAKIRERGGMLDVTFALLGRDEEGQLRPLNENSEPDQQLLNEISRLVGIAREQSTHSCKRCGAPSNLRRVYGRLSTLCEDCMSKQRAEVTAQAATEGLARLMIRHPRLFRWEPPTIESDVAPGREPLLNKFFDEINFMLDDEHAAMFWVHQIKEKLGTLRVYVALSDERTLGGDDDRDQGAKTFIPDESVTRRIFKLADVASRQSATLCYRCGALGWTRDVNGWLSTVCDPCLSSIPGDDDEEEAL